MSVHGVLRDFMHTNRENTAAWPFRHGGIEIQRLSIPHDLTSIVHGTVTTLFPAHIRKKLIELEDDDSTSIGQPPQPTPAGRTSSEEFPIDNA